MTARILIVDDSVVIRQLLKEVLAGDPQLEVAGVAANGQIALAMLNQLSPDLVTLDVEMPVLDGLETLKQLRQSHPRLPVIMFSTLTARGAQATIESLAFGASDYVTKPSNVGSVTVAKERIREQLIPKIKALCKLTSGTPSVPPVRLRPSAPLLTQPRLYQRASAVNVVAIGCSTGGPNALAEVLPNLPANFAAPVVVVQHMPATFTRFLAQRLDSICALRVREAVSGEPLQQGTIWIAPGDFHLKVIKRGAELQLVTEQSPPENSCRPSVDVLFRSMVTAYGGNVLAVVLTGMGQDGLRGCKELYELGAHIVVQDEATSVVWGMPGFVAREQLADRVLPLQEIGPEITRRVVFQSQRVRGLQA
ncbi:MAG: chemotaxis response regulator protein-glutamate methylesterase [Candidatus Korobacteraceae bacterium]|jgi:two-component system chemotaxis response regulator CheB